MGDNIPKSLYFLISLIKINEEQKPFVSKVVVLFNINCLLNITWIFAWHYKIFPLSLIIMLGLLYTLILISRVIKTCHKKLKSSYLYNISSFSFNIYFGWITVATVANFTGLLVSLEWGGFGISHELWTSFIIVVAAIIASITFIKNRAIWYLLPIIWAFYGIYYRHTVYLDSEYPLVINTLLLGISILIILVISSIFFKKKILNH